MCILLRQKLKKMTMRFSHNIPIYVTIGIRQVITHLGAGTDNNVKPQDMKCLPPISITTSFLKCLRFNGLLHQTAEIRCGANSSYWVSDMQKHLKSVFFSYHCNIYVLGALFTYINLYHLFEYVKIPKS